MITPNELRLGNYVMDEVSGEWMIVDSIGPSVSATLLNRDKFPLPDGWVMVPIPLTSGILNKCGHPSGIGVLRNGEPCLWEILGVGVYLKEDGSFTVFLSNDIPMFTYLNSPSIKSLHRLQNIIFALTGEEIKISN